MGGYRLTNFHAGFKIFVFAVAELKPLLCSAQRYGVIFTKFQLLIMTKRNGEKELAWIKFSILHWQSSSSPVTKKRWWHTWMIEILLFCYLIYSDYLLSVTNTHTIQQWRSLFTFIRKLFVAPRALWALVDLGKITEG